MNCRTVQDQLTRDADGAPSAPRQSALDAHVRSCAECRQFEATLHELGPLMRNEIESVAVPSADEMWREISDRLDTPVRSRKIAPIIWLAAPLAAAAALVFAFLPLQGPQSSPTIADNNTMQVNYVEIEDPNATAMVYVDKESGWLVVWADDPTANSG